MNDDYKEHQRTNEVEDILKNSEVFSEKVDELIDNKMEEQYFDKILPLEKEIVRLGGSIPKKNKSEIDILLKFLQYTPNDPFKEQDRYPYYWETPESDYYRFFKALLSACMERSWIVIAHPCNLNDVTSYWLKMFRCVDDLDMVFNASKEEFVRPFKWQGKVNLCIYLNDKLREDKFVKSTKNNHIISNHFLPESDIANSRNQSKNNKTGKPIDYEEVDKMISEILDTLD